MDEKEKILNSEETKKDLEAFKNQAQIGQNYPFNQICPHCGYCPICGRPYRNYNYPYYLYPYWSGGMYC